MAINPFQNSNPYSLFPQALGLPFPAQTDRRSQGTPLATPPANPFQIGTLGLGEGADQFTAFQGLISSGLLRPNLEQPPVPPEGMGRRFLATA